MTKKHPLPWRALTIACVASSALVTSLVVPMPIRLIYNVSASVPTGLYAVSPAEQLHRGDLVAVIPPEPLASWLVEGGYLGRNAPLLKRIEALPGERVCRHGMVVTVGVVVRAVARDRDSSGRPLPRWDGCRVVGERELFLLNPDRADSLDGRYFGPLPRAAVVGRASPLWTSGAP
jgi:conjugative transfer signal peptidase TraF